MTAKQRKALDAALRTMFRERGQSDSTARLADLVRSLPSETQKAA